MFEIKLERMKFESSSKSWKVQLKLERSIEVGKFNRIWKDNVEKTSCAWTIAGQCIIRV